MDDLDYPIAHFKLMTRVAEWLKDRPFQLLEHTYSYRSMGSWWIRLRYRGKHFRIVFEGRDGDLTLDMSYQPVPDLLSFKLPRSEWRTIGRSTIKSSQSEEYILACLVSLLTDIDRLRQSA